MGSISNSREDVQRIESLTVRYKNDQYLQILYNRLNQLAITALPVTGLISNGEFKGFTYSDEHNKAVDSIKKDIDDYTKNKYGELFDLPIK